MPPRTTMLTLAAAFVAAISLPVMWIGLGRGEESLHPVQRTLAELDLDWRCETGHTFHAAGHEFNKEGTTKPRPCWTCGRPAYPFKQYYCKVHGAYDVMVIFAKDDRDGSKPSRWRAAGRSWVEERSKLRCPLCNRRLEYRRDVVNTARHGKKPGGE